MANHNLENMTFLTKVSFFATALVAGLVHWGKRELSDKTFWQKLFLFLYDSTVAGSISIFTGLIVLGYTDNVALSLGLGGIFGHLGNRTLGIVEEAIRQKLHVKNEN